ncbi:hypothetical protein ERO13_D02G231400v2 [Gossypium hirsutum]|uniref:Zinc finger protein ZAT3 n=1 Tax=Gossypium hirsutum TaxID=3635 RepID=A0A1U8JKS5_GOSHI|nr:zinc finger protein ZAT3-like [Gossypium hirsutum]KAG4160349.1 hypothetical protein ERO13_D02G231400v2 [Gossypium hirsutum]
MNENVGSDSGFRFPSSVSQHDIALVKCDQNHKKKRSKSMKVDTTGFPNSSSPVSRPKYTKKPDPSAPKITPPCSECGKKFWSWKALFGHMRCHPERQWRGINPPPKYRRPVSPVKEMNDIESSMTEEDHVIAASLLMLANGTTSETEPNMVQETDTFRFECSSCKKVFGSHQALGGHRASHKNVKGCFAITRTDGGYEVDDKTVMFLGHKCSICLRVFSSGQALGGHKRCHWDKNDEPSLNHFEPGQGGCLDLNLPAPTPPVELENASSSSYSSCMALDLSLSL